MGRKPRRPRRPAARVSVRSGAKFSMPGMMDTVLNLGLNDRVVKGLAAADRRRALRLRLLPPLHLDVRPHRARHRRRARSTSRFETAKDAAGVDDRRRGPGRGAAPRCARRYKAGRRRRTPASRSRRTRSTQLRGAIEAVFRSLERRPRHRLPRARAHQPRPRHRRQRAGDGVRQPRRQLRHRRRLHPQRRPPARTSRTATSSSTPRARTSWPASATPRTSTRSTDHFPKIHAELLAIFARLERHYRDMCDTEFTIEQGKLWMLQTRVGKRTGARRAAHGRRHDDGPSDPADRQAEAVAARHRRPPRPGAAPAVRRHGPQGARQGPGRVAGRRRRPGLLHRRRRRRRAAERGEQVILVRNETSPEDVHGMMVAEGILTARGGLVSHAAVVARGWGNARRRRRRGGPDRRHASSPSGDVDRQRGRLISLDGTDRRGRPRRGDARPRPSRPPSSTPSSVGRRRSARATSPCGPTPTTAPDAANARQFGAEGIGLCRTEHMFLGRGPPAGRAPHDPRRHARRRRPPRSRSCASSRRPTSRRSSRRWTACRSRCACSTRRCTSSCPTVEELAHQGGHRRARPPRSRRCSTAAAVVARVQPDARHPRRAPRRRQAGPLRHAGARPDGGGRRAGGRRAATRSSRS